jgi:hypothetical protein
MRTIERYAMQQSDQNYIEHEIKIRLLEAKNSDMYKTFDKIDRRFEHLENKIDNQFKWIIGSIVGLFCGTFLPLFAGILLHMAKLI